MNNKITNEKQALKIIYNNKEGSYSDLINIIDKNILNDFTTSGIIKIFKNNWKITHHGNNIFFITFSNELYKPTLFERFSDFLNNLVMKI